MVIVNPVSGLISLEFAQKFGLPNGYGLVQFGWSQFGDDNERAGYYQTRPRPTGRILVKTRHYWPTQNPGIEEQARRSHFADGVTSWQALAPAEKELYNDLKYPEGRSGFNRYMSYWMRGVIS